MSDKANSTRSKAITSSCERCKARHIKCDSGPSPCSNCTRDNNECVRNSNLKFRHYLHSNVSTQGSSVTNWKLSQQFAGDQTWANTKRQLHFVHHTGNFETLDDDEVSGLSSSPPAAAASNSPFSAPSFAGSPTGTSSSVACEASTISSSFPSRRHANKRRKSSISTSTTSDLDSIRTSSRPSEAPPRFTPPSFPSQKGIADAEVADTIFRPLPHFANEVPNTINEDQHQRDAAYFQASAEAIDPCLELELYSNHNGDSQIQAGVYISSPQWPLKTEQEAMLFRYFIEVLAPIFDLCDDACHFAKEIPRQAVFCPPLLSAIMSVSAKHISRIHDDFDSLAVDRYHQKCLDVLIPELSSSAAAMDDSLLAAIVMLRYVEELSVPVTETPPEYHLMGTRVFIAAQNGTINAAGAGGLRLATFLVALRQEVHLALTQSRPIHPNFVLDGVEDMLPQDDNGCRYANLMIFQCAACVSYCNDPSAHSVEAWERLQEAQQRLWDERPWMFHPLYADPKSDDGVLPVERYLNDAAVTGVQHFHLAQIIMAAHNPIIPKVGPSHLKATRKINEDIKRTVKIICGIAKSNAHRKGSSYVNACIAINLAGDRFVDRHEQEVLYNLLVAADAEIAWPTQATSHVTADEACAEIRGYAHAADGNDGGLRVLALTLIASGAWPDLEVAIGLAKTMGGIVVAETAQLDEGGDMLKALSVPSKEEDISADG